MTCVLDYSQKPVVFRCTICNGTAPVPLPLLISQLRALTDDFHNKHKACKRGDRHGDVLAELADTYRTGPTMQMYNAALGCYETVLKSDLCG